MQIIDYWISQKIEECWETSHGKNCGHWNLQVTEVMALYSVSQEYLKIIGCFSDFQEIKAESQKIKKKPIIELWY